MSHASSYQQQHLLPSSSFEDGSPPHPPSSHPSGGLPPAFLASLQSLYPSVSPTSKTAQDIAAYLNGTASISYETRLDTGYQQQINTQAAPSQAIVQARAIETLLAQAKNAQIQSSTQQQQQQPNLASYGMPNNTYLGNNNNQRGESLQQPIQAPILPFNLFPYQQYLHQHQQRFNQPQQQQYNQFSNFQQQHQQQPSTNQYQAAPFYPSLPFLAQGTNHHAQYTDLNSSASTNSTIESPSLPELGQDFIYDPAAFDLSGASTDFGDVNAVSPFSVPSHGAYDFAKAANGGGYASTQQQQPFDMASLDQDSPLTSSSPSSSFTALSPYAFNNVGDSSLSNSGSEYDFQACSVSVVGANASVDNNTASGGEVEKKKHVCDVCHRGFARAFNLKSHMHTHLPTRYKPFLCPSKDCSRSFSRSHDMERHRSGIHQEGPLAAKAGLIPEDSPLAAPGVKASTTKKQRASRGVASTA